MNEKGDVSWCPSLATNFTIQKLSSNWQGFAVVFVSLFAMLIEDAFFSAMILLGEVLINYE